MGCSAARCWPSGITQTPNRRGGIGGCCTSCAGTQGCAAFSYSGAAGGRGGRCTLLSRVNGTVRCPAGADANGHPVPCGSGTPGAFPKFTSLPQHFKNHGYLSMGTGKLFHDGGAGFGGVPGDVGHPAGPGTPPLADPVSWTNTTVNFPDCNWTRHRGGGGEPGDEWTVSCPGLPSFVNAYGPHAVTRGSAYLVPAGQGSCGGVPRGPFTPAAGKAATMTCTEDVPADGAGGDPDGGINGRPPLIDVPVYLNAKRKLEYAKDNLEKTGQPFFLNASALPIVTQLSSLHARICPPPQLAYRCPPHAQGPRPSP